MKEQVLISFATGPRPWAGIQRIFLEAGLSRLADEGPNIVNFYAARLQAGDPRLNTLRNLLRTEGIEWSERRERLYNSDELRAAPMLWMIIRSPEIGLGGPTYGTRFDLSTSCRRCGTGAVQTSPLVMQASDLPANAHICNTFDSDVLASPEITESLRGTSVTGIELRQVLDSSTQRPLPWFQILPQVTLPPMAPQTVGVIRGNPPPCQRCMRDGHFHHAGPIEIAYRRDEVDPDTIPDVVMTWECFGKSRIAEPFRDSHFAQGLILVKPKVFDILQAYRVRGVEYVPVSFVG